MKKTGISLLLAAALLFGQLSLPIAAAEALPAAADTLGAETACAGNHLGQFNGVPACVNDKGELHICENNFPDEVLRKYCFGTAKTYTTLQEMNQRTTLPVYNKGITTMEGIEFFPALTDLKCYLNTKLTRLDVSNNKTLQSLECYTCYMQELVIGENPNLTYLKCTYNKLNELDVSGATALETLECNNSSIKSLKVSGATALQTLNCASNSMTELVLDNNPALTTLNCSEIKSLTRLDVSGAPALVTLDSHINYYNGRSNVEELNLEHNPKLQTLKCRYNGLQSLNITGNPELNYLDCSENALTELDISQNTKLTYLNCGSNRKIPFLALTSCPELVDLDCSYNKLSELDLSGNPDLETLRLSINDVSELDLSHNPKLYLLAANDNEFTHLSLNGVTALQYLACGGNPLEELDLSGNPALLELSVDSSPLTELNLEHNPLLTELSVNSAHLAELDLSHNPALTKLSCRSGELTTLDVSGNPALESIDCYQNRLTELDVSGNPELSSLACRDNQIAELDLRANTKLKTLNCVGNGLTELDLSQNTKLTNLDCYSNRLATLDLSQNTALQTYSCNGQSVNAYRTQREDGKWVLDLKELVGAENLDRITSVSEGEWDQQAGTVVLEINSYPESLHLFTYYYDLRLPNKPTATLTVYTYTYPSEPMHEWGKPVFSWSEDGKTATATFTCTAEGEPHTKELAATMSEAVTKEAGCTDTGIMTYTASVELDGNSYTDTHEVILDATGHSYTDYRYNQDATYFADGTETADCDNGCGEQDTRPKEGSRLTDEEAPTVTITVGGKAWQEFLNRITFGLFFKDAQTVTVEATDAGVGVDTVAYYLTDQALSREDMDGITDWTAYDTPVPVEPNRSLVVYVKATDLLGNVGYYSTDGMVFDSVLPVITGVTDHASYCAPQTVTVTEEYLSQITVNGTPVETDENGSFLLPADGEQVIVAVDQAGNRATVTVTVHDGHSWGEWNTTKEPTTTETGLKERECSVCGESQTEELAVLPRADYRALDEALAKVPEDLSGYPADLAQALLAAVEAAKAADRDLPADRQAEVDALTTAVEEALAALNARLRGDVNRDKKVTVADALEALRAAVGLTELSGGGYE